jgi:hypothetical protein
MFTRGYLCWIDGHLATSKAPFSPRFLAIFWLFFDILNTNEPSEDFLAPPGQLC